MIISIVTTGKNKIGTDKNGKFNVGEVATSLKEVPFVRYRFEEYGEEELKYITNSIGKFIYSSHLVEIPLDDNTEGVLDLVCEMNVAKYIYINITDAEVSGGLSDDTNRLLEDISCYSSVIDRIMLKDNSQTLDYYASNKLRVDISRKMGVEEDKVGVCSSPLSFCEQACLTAVKARELAAKYSSIQDGALPTANHENMNTCGCIRYLIVDKDIHAPIAGKVSNISSSSKSSSGSSGKVVNKKVLPRF